VDPGKTHAKDPDALIFATLRANELKNKIQSLSSIWKLNIFMATSYWLWVAGYQDIKIQRQLSDNTGVSTRFISIIQRFWRAELATLTGYLLIILKQQTAPPFAIHST
jgi:hypothetical protein